MPAQEFYTTPAACCVHANPPRIFARGAGVPGKISTACSAHANPAPTQLAFLRTMIVRAATAVRACCARTEASGQYGGLCSEQLRPGMQPRVRAAATCSHACVLINASISTGRAMKMMNRCDLDFDECIPNRCDLDPKQENRNCSDCCGNGRPQLFGGNEILGEHRGRQNASQKNATHGARRICFQHILRY